MAQLLRNLSGKGVKKHKYVEELLMLSYPYSLFCDERFLVNSGVNLTEVISFNHWIQNAKNRKISCKKHCW